MRRFWWFYLLKLLTMLIQCEPCSLGKPLHVHQRTGLPTRNLCINDVLIQDGAYSGWLTCMLSH